MRCSPKPSKPAPRSPGKHTIAPGGSTPATSATPTDTSGRSSGIRAAQALHPDRRHTNAREHLLTVICTFVRAAWAQIHAVSRVNRAFEASFRKLQDAARAKLHLHEDAGTLKGW